MSLLKPSARGCRTYRLRHVATAAAVFSERTERTHRRRQCLTVGFVSLLAKQHGETAEIDRDEFFQYALRASTGYNITFAGTAQKLADQMEEMFEATGSRGGFMLSIAPGSPRAIMLISSTSWCRN